MAHCELLTILLIACVLAVSLQQAFALQCWECNSNSKDACKSSDGAKLPNEMLMDCDRSFESPVCLKLASTSFDYVQRICAQNKAAAERACDEVRIHDKGAFCGICETDRCNGAIQFGPVTGALIAIPMAIMKILSL